MKTSLATFIERRVLGISVDAPSYASIEDAGLEINYRKYQAWAEEMQVRRYTLYFGRDQSPEAQASVLCS
jgi:hypothetical protein